LADPTKVIAAAQTAPWWSEWVKAAPTLIGVVIGAALTVVYGAIQRHWSRNDKARELTISRGEELLDLCRQLHEWDDAGRKMAFTGESLGFIPTQAPVFRIASIVELYFPELSQQAQTVNNVTGDYRHHLRGIAMFLHGGGQLSDEKRRALNEEQARFELALRTFLLAARTRIGELVNSE
jgi:hypothetical protein